MASIHSKKGKSGKKTYYVVVSHSGKHKWIRAGTQQQAKILVAITQLTTKPT